MSKGALAAPTVTQTANFVAWQKHVAAKQGLPFGDVLTTFLVARNVGNALAEIENASTPSPDIGFDP